MNQEECRRAVQLVRYFISQGFEPSKITALAAYQQQMSEISRKIKEELPGFLRENGFKRELVPFRAFVDPTLIKRGNVVDITDSVLEQYRVIEVKGRLVKTGRYTAKVDDQSAEKEGKVVADLEPSNLQPDEMPEVSTIDRYQGAENQIVIVSLVRSNQEKKLGFLGTDDGRNRMCVAQSRAKRGLYFIGNVECLQSAVHWKQLLGMLDERGCVGDKFPQICPRHPDLQNFAKEADDVGILQWNSCIFAFVFSFLPVVWVFGFVLPPRHCMQEGV